MRAVTANVSCSSWRQVTRITSSSRSPRTWHAVQYRPATRQRLALSLTVYRDAAANPAYRG
jgi:hypothetical protein